METLKVMSFSLHTLKGQPVMKMTCEGLSSFAPGDVVNADDFGQWICERATFRGVIDHVLVKFDAGNVMQEITVNLEKHQWIDSGKYKKKGVAKAAPKIDFDAAVAIAKSNGTLFPSEVLKAAQAKVEAIQKLGLGLQESALVNAASDIAASSALSFEQALAAISMFANPAPAIPAAKAKSKQSEQKQEAPNIINTTAKRSFDFED